MLNNYGFFFTILVVSHVPKTCEMTSLKKLDRQKKYRLHLARFGFGRIFGSVVLIEVQIPASALERAEPWKCSVALVTRLDSSRVMFTL
jgi:hypothetical protein